MLNDKKILVLGLGKSGYHVIKLLAGNNTIVACDKNMPDEEKISEFQKLNVIFKQSPDATEILDESFDLLIKSPGIEPFHPCVKKAKELNIKIVNEMEVAYHYLPKNVKIIGITGSNGKTTTTTMLYELLKLHGISAILGGNIGFPLCEILNSVKEGDTLVLEISDHQLNDLTDFKTDISILTNLCPTHLDFHGNYENYKNVKKKIFNHHTSSDLAIINNYNQDSLELTRDILSHKIYFNDENNYYNEEGIFVNKEKILNLDEIKIQGNHNYENILACLLALRKFAFDKDIIKKYFKDFKGVEHRIEIVESQSKAKFYNDSKSTNPTSTLIALKTMKENVHLILGGKERMQDFHELDNEIKKVKCIYAIGEITDRIDEYAKENNVPCLKCYTLDKAMTQIQKNVKDNDVVLLSPGSASWDQYDRFETRGEEFKKLVEKLFN